MPDTVDGKSKIMDSPPVTDPGGAIRRIVFISIFRENCGGGEGRVAHEMARRFAARYQAALICPEDDTRLHMDRDHLTILGIRSSGQGSASAPLLSRVEVGRIFNFLDEFRPDIIHVHDPTLIGVFGQIWARMHSVPFVYTAHVLPDKLLEFGARDVVNFPINALTERISLDLIRNFHDNCDAIVALNRTIGDRLIRFGYAGRLFVIPNGCDLEIFRRCRTADPRSAEKILTFIGFLNARKNQMYLLEMMRHLHGNYTLQLAGECLGGRYERNLREYAKRNRLDNVRFLGVVPYEEIPRIIERSHLLVSASQMEVQSLVVIEALAAGTPVVGLANETIDELVGEGNGRRLVKDAAPAEFARRVEEICSLPLAKYARLCAGARESVAHLDWSRVDEMTVGMYHALAQRKAPAGEQDRLRLRRFIGLIPSAPLRRTLLSRMVLTAARMRKVRRVSNQTWIIAGLTMVVSAATYFMLREKIPLIKPK